jgi:hypothetical protein
VKTIYYEEALYVYDKRVEEILELASTSTLLTTDLFKKAIGYLPEMQSVAMSTKP